ncbi:hypothetical protein V8E55_012076 [Tylopilus felleus]
MTASKCYVLVADDISVRTHLARHLKQQRPYANQSRLSRAAIFSAVDASLAQPETTYFGLLQIARYDPEVPAEETMKPLHDLVERQSAVHWYHSRPRSKTPRPNNPPSTCETDFAVPEEARSEGHQEFGRIAWSGASSDRVETFGCIHAPCKPTLFRGYSSIASGDVCDDFSGPFCLETFVKDLCIFSLKERRSDVQRGTLGPDLNITDVVLRYTYAPAFEQNSVGSKFQ